MTPEKQVQNQIITYLKSLKDRGEKVYYERRQAGGFSYKMGIADLYAVIDGRHIEIEVKRPGGKLKPMQIKWKEQCEQKNILYVCASSIKDVKSFIEKNFDFC